MADPYLFYGTRVSFFSAKVRCALRAKGLTFHRALAGTGLEPLLAAAPRLRVHKKGFQLVYAEA
jgi:hypothetical protein